MGLETAALRDNDEKCAWMGDGSMVRYRQHMGWGQTLGLITDPLPLRETSLQPLLFKHSLPDSGSKTFLYSRKWGFLLYGKENDTSRVQWFFRIYWGEKAFILSGTSWTLQKRSFDNAEKPLIVQKKHLILAETFNECVMSGGKQFQLCPYCRMECPSVTLSKQRSMGHHWSLILITQLSEVVIMIVSGTWAIPDGDESKLENQLRTAQLYTRPT